MAFMPTWFNAYCILVSILVTIVLFGFIIQTYIHKYNEKDELTTTFSILSTIGLIKILCSCASSYVFTCWVLTADTDTSSNLTDWLDFIRIIALFSQMLFLVWRLELTFVRTNYQLSKTGLIFYHITIIVCIVLVTFLNIQILESEFNDYPYIYYPAELMRLGVFFAVAYQFMNKLFDLIASQHSSNSQYTSPQCSRLIMTVTKSHSDSRDSYSDMINASYQLLNQVNHELEKSSFSSRNYKLISIVTKLSFLACLDFVALFLYVTFVETWTILYDHEIKQWIMFYNIYFTIEPVSWIIFSLTVWFSFTFAEKQYLCLFGCCHYRFMTYFEKKAKKRTLKQTVAAISPDLSPFLNTSKEKFLSSIELKELERNLMET